MALKFRDPEGDPSPHPARISARRPPPSPPRRRARRPRARRRPRPRGIAPLETKVEGFQAVGERDPVTPPHVGAARSTPDHAEDGAPDVVEIDEWLPLASMFRKQLGDAAPATGEPTPDWPQKCCEAEAAVGEPKAKSSSTTPRRNLRSGGRGALQLGQRACSTRKLVDAAEPPAPTSAAPAPRRRRWQPGEAPRQPTPTSTRRWTATRSRSRSAQLLRIHDRVGPAGVRAREGTTSRPRRRTTVAQKDGDDVQAGGEKFLESIALPPRRRPTSREADGVLNLKSQIQVLHENVLFDAPGAPPPQRGVDGGRQGGG